MTDFISAQIKPFEYPSISLSKQQKLYAENLVKTTQTLRVKGNVKSLKIIELEGNYEGKSNGNGEKKLFNKYFKINSYEFLPNNKLKIHKYQYGIRGDENTSKNAILDTTTTKTAYYFDEINDKLLKITETLLKRSEKHITETKINSEGFISEKIAYNLNENEEKEVYYSIKYVLRRNKISWVKENSNLEDERGKLSLRGENYKKINNPKPLMTSEFIGNAHVTKQFDGHGNIVTMGSYEPDIRSSLPNNYTFTYQYNEDNELIEIHRNGIGLISYHNFITKIVYENYDKNGNWQNMTIKTSDDSGSLSEVKYRREIRYY
jgi:hypothetical protein